MLDQPIVQDYSALTAILRCPITGEDLVYWDASSDLPPELQAIVDVEATQGYVNDSQTVFYPIKNNIVCLLPEYAFNLLDQETETDSKILEVQSFYDQFGWKKDDSESYNDNKLFIAQHTLSDEYHLETTRRVNQHLSPKGTYLLDIASGPIYQKEYLEFSQNFTYRICIDISIEALLDAQRNLKDQKGFFILGDITNIPLRSNSCDSVMSLHTLYHVPAHKQADGFRELVRVCKVAGKVVIAYNWGWHSMLMNVTLLPSRAVNYLKRITRKYFKKGEGFSTPQDLYFYAHGPGFFKKHQPKNATMKFTVLRTLHDNFLRFYIREELGGKKLLDQVTRLEEKYPSWLGRHGAFTLIVLEKTAAE